MSSILLISRSRYSDEVMKGVYKCMLTGLYKQNTVAFEGKNVTFICGAINKNQYTWSVHATIFFIY